MKAPIRARFSASAALLGQAFRVMLPGGKKSVTEPTAHDFTSGAWISHRRMSPAEVRFTLEQAATGSLQAQWELFAMMEDSWPRLAKNLAELRRAASRATYAVQPYAERWQAPTESAMERASLVDQAMRQWWPKPGTMELGFEDTLYDALDAYGKGISVLELHWERTGEGILPRAAHVVAPQRYSWNSDGTELGLVTDTQRRAWEPFPEDHFLVGIWRARTGAPGATAVLRALAPYWIGITYGWEWLLSNAQLFGVPFRWATYDKSTPNLANVLRDMLAEMGASGYGAFPDGTKLEFREASQNVTGNPQVVVQELADRACDLLILGQELSGAAQAAGLGGSAAALQSSVRADRLQAAAQWCSDLLNYQLVPAVLRANWGDTSEPPTVVADIDDEPDPLKLAQRDQVLLTAGVELPRSWFYERHAIPMPVEGEAVIVGRSASAPPPAPLALPPPPVRPALAAKAAPTRADQLFRTEALRDLTRAEATALRPLIARALDVLDLPDDQFAGGVERLRRDLPQIQRQVLKGSSSGPLVAAWERILGTALLSGAAEAAREQLSPDSTR
jgi:phage gp29-like protein